METKQGGASPALTDEERLREILIILPEENVHLLRDYLVNFQMFDEGQDNMLGQYMEFIQRPLSDFHSPPLQNLRTKFDDALSRLLAFMRTSFDADSGGYVLKQVSKSGTGVATLQEYAKSFYESYASLLKEGSKIVSLRRSEDIISELPSFSDDGVLSFFNKKIAFSKNTDPHDLLHTIFKDPKKIWNQDEILDDWSGMGFAEEVDKIRNKVYQAGKAVNRRVAMDTTIKDFLDVTTRTIRVNPKYLQI